MKNTKVILFILIFTLLIFASTYFVLAQTSVSPADIIDLAVENVTDTTVTLSWSAPGDDGYFGFSDHYDMRMSTSLFNSALWNNLTSVSGLPSPSNPGTKDSVVVGSLTPNTTYYFAVRGVDADGNTSQVFNIIQTTTLNSISGSQNTISNLNFIPQLEYGSLTGRNFTISFFGQGSSNLIDEFSQVPNLSGLVTLPANITLNTGIYDVGVKTNGYLSKKSNGVNLFSNLNIQLPTLLKGDLNSDGIINSLDWSLISPNWFSTSSDSYDLNSDGIINSLDWSIMSKNWFLTSDF